MKRILTANRDRVLLFVLALFVLTLPLKNNFNSLAIILLCVYAFVILIIERKIYTNLLLKFVPLFLYFIFSLSSLLYTEDMQEGLKLANRLLPFLLLPLIFSILEINKTLFLRILRVFVFVMLAVCLYSHTMVLIKLYENNDILFNIFNSHYSYLSLSEDTIGLHSTYYAYYIIVAIVFLTKFLFNEKRWMLRLGYFILIGYFTFFVFHLSARLPIATLFIFYNIALIYYFTKQKKIVKGVLFLLALYIVSSIVLYNVRITRYRFQHLLGFTYSDGTHHEDGRDKLLQWKAAIAANNNFILGNGIGDADTAIYESYVAFDLKKYADRQYNAHNQFIQTYVGLGIIGMFLLLFIFFFYFKEFYKNSFFLGYVLILLTFILFQTESYLQRHNGIVMLVFLICLFMNYTIQKEEKLLK